MTMTLNSKFEQLYLTDKILGESMPLKTNVSKCATEWQIVSEVSIIDMGNVLKSG